LEQKWGAELVAHGADTVEFGWQIEGDPARSYFDRFEGVRARDGHGWRLGFREDSGDRSFQPRVPGVELFWYSRYGLLKAHPKAIPRGRDVDGLAAWVEDALLPSLLTSGVTVKGRCHVHRLDVFVDVRFRSAAVCRGLFDALALGRFPRRRFARIYQGAAAVPTGLQLMDGRQVVGRAYDKPRQAGETADPWTAIRLEAQARFRGERPTVERLSWVYAQGIWAQRWRTIAEVDALTYEPLMDELLERVRAGRLTVAEYEKLAGYLYAEARGVADGLYPSGATLSRRRKLALQENLRMGSPTATTETIGLEGFLEACEGAWRGD
jgi:hypothetical protein